MIKIREFVSAPHFELKGVGPYPYMNYTPIFSGGINDVLANSGKKIGDHISHFMLSTGKKVKNNKELWAGDVVKIPVSETEFDLAIVHMDMEKGKFVFEVYWNNVQGDSEHYIEDFEDFNSLEHMELIGDVFSAPYLLKGEINIVKREIEPNIKKSYEASKESVKNVGDFKSMAWMIIGRFEKKQAEHRKTELGWTLFQKDIEAMKEWVASISDIPNLGIIETYFEV